MTNKTYLVVVHGSFFNDVCWDQEVREIASFQSKENAEVFAEGLRNGDITVSEWDRIQDPSCVVEIFED